MYCDGREAGLINPAPGRRSIEGTGEMEGKEVDPFCAVRVQIGWSLLVSDREKNKLFQETIRYEW
jgi:hypothetical protein